MEKKDLGNLLLIEGAVIFISSTLFWVIASRIFRIYTFMFHFGLIDLSIFLTVFFIITSHIVKGRKGKNDIIHEGKDLVFSILYIVFGIYIFMLIVLVDSPIGPPILGPSNMNVDYWGWPELMFLMSLPELILIFSGIGLLINKSRMWLVIGGLMLIVSMGLLQDWFGTINMVYEWAVFRY